MTMQFTFFVAVKNAIELHRYINVILERWFPTAVWTHNVVAITQILGGEENEKDGTTAEKTKRKKAELIDFQVTAEINPNHLENEVRKIGYPT